ncbi:MAG TPA: hypothetical protein VK801_02770 [Caulobacteraceae bacterium]|jgi:hypothetical protein|nr:hypothetical protein [Caulobacteraceae bacterium]
MVILVLLVACASAGLFAFIGVMTVRKLARRHLDDRGADMCAAIFQTGGTLYSVFLAFLVVAVWQAHDAAHANVAEEASLLGTLYRGSTAMEPGPGNQMRVLIRRYTHAVIEDEWPIQEHHGGASERARAAGLGMFRLFSTLPSQVRQADADVDGMELSLIAQIQADRNKRTLQAEEYLSPLIWATALVNGLLVLIISFLLEADRVWIHVGLSGLLAVMIATLLSVIFILDRPFGGLMPLQPDAFVHSLAIYDSVDRSP